MPAAPYARNKKAGALQPMVDRLATAMGLPPGQAPVVLVTGLDPQVGHKGIAVYPANGGQPPKIVVNPTAINALTSEELAYLLAHEVGHIQDVTRPGFKTPWKGVEGATPLRAAGEGGEVPEVPPPLQPDDDPMPGAEPAGDVIARVLAEMSPTGKASAQRYGSEVAHRAPWMEGIVAGTEAPPTGDAARYEDILALTTGDAQAGADVARVLDEAEATGESQGYQPPRKLTKRERERIGNLPALENLPPHERELAERARDVTVDDLTQAHGFRTQKDAQEAAQNILPYILQFARGARPNEPVSEVLLTAGRAAWAQSHFPTYYAEIDYQKALRDPNASPEDIADAKQASDYWDAVRQVLSRYGGEIAPSEVGRAFRSMRDRPQGVVPEVAGGSGVGATPTPSTPREKAAERMRREWAKKTRNANAARSPEEIAKQRELRRAEGKRVNGPLEAMGIEWDDVLRRSGDDDYDRATMLAGLADLGIGKRHPDYKKWTDQLFADDFLDDAGRVEQFWLDAYRATGRDANRIPFTKFDPNVEGQSYLGSVDTLTKAQATKLVEDAIRKSTDEATRAVREAVRADKPPGEIERLKGVVERAYGRVGIELARWTDEGQAVPGALTGKGLLKRITDQWPADRKAASGATEDVEKKRQLLGMLDQEMKAEQGKGVNWTSDLLSFGTSNVLTTARFVQAATLESLLTSVNEPFQSLLKGDYAGAGRQLQGLARAFGLPGAEEMATLAEGIKAPALANAMKALRDIGPMEASGDLAAVAERGAGQIRSDSQSKLVRWGTPMHRVSRALGEAFQTGNYMAEVNRLVHQVSKQAPGKGRLPDGTTIEAVLDEVTGMPRNPTPQELFGNLPQSIKDAALKKSKMVTEGGEANAVERAIGEAKGLLTKPGAKGHERAIGLFSNLLFPFVYGLRPMINAGTGVVTSPVKHTNEFVQALRNGDREGAKYAAKKFALANTFNGFVAYQVMGGNITGHGPSDPQRRQALLEATDENGDPVWRPDSYRIPTPGGGHTWVKYTSLPGPIPIVASVMANLYDAYVFEGKSPETSNETAARMAGTVLELLPGQHLPARRHQPGGGPGLALAHADRQPVPRLHGGALRSWRGRAAHRRHRHRPLPARDQQPARRPGLRHPRPPPAAPSARLGLHGRGGGAAPVPTHHRRGPGRERLRLPLGAQPGGPRRGRPLPTPSAGGARRGHPARGVRPPDLHQRRAGPRRRPGQHGDAPERGGHPRGPGRLRPGGRAPGRLAAQLPRLPGHVPGGEGGGAQPHLQHRPPAGRLTPPPGPPACSSTRRTSSGGGRRRRRATAGSRAPPPRSPARTPRSPPPTPPTRASPGRWARCARGASWPGRPPR